MDDRLFRRAMGTFATGVTVITAGNPDTDGIHGMTANAFMSVSLNPKLIVISIGEKARMLEKIRKNKRFAVNILSSGQKDLSMVFAGQKNDEGNIAFDELSGIPVLQDAMTKITCEVVNEHTEGDHTLFIGKVLDIAFDEDAEDPLIFFKGEYRSLLTKETVK